MKRLLYIFVAAFALAACAGLENSNPYLTTLQDVEVCPQYPQEYASCLRAGVNVVLEDMNLGNKYCCQTTADGKALFTVPTGLYRLSVSDLYGDEIFNGTMDKIAVKAASSLNLPLVHSKAGHIIIKEIYCGGCMKTPEQGTYQVDQYIILHNNYPMTEYLDGLCFGTLCPYNSNSNNPFGEIPEQVPLIQAVWMFPGSGKDFPVEPGEDAVLCLRGAIDHSAQYPLSVNLNKPEYFVCYNPTYFTNTVYHPAPGNNISTDRWLDVLVKTGQANAFTYSVNSPASVLFRFPEDVDASRYVSAEGSIVQVPGSTADRVLMVPPEWVIEAVEVFNGESTSNSKRLLPSLDAGYVTQSGTFLGHTLYRYTDEQLTEAMGYEVLKDTNNSSADFYERETQSLHE